VGEVCLYFDLNIETLIESRKLAAISYAHLIKVLVQAKDISNTADLVRNQGEGRLERGGEA